MGFFKTLFTGKEETEEEKKEQRQKNDFDMFKYDGIQAARMGRLDYAMECFERALAIHDDSETRRYYANALLRDNDIEGAIEEFENLRNLEPDDASVVLSLADLYFQIEDYDKMEEACNATIEKDASLAMPHYLLAKKYNAQGDMINAVAQATQAIANKDDFDDAYLLRAQILFQMQQFADAEKDIDVILEANAESDDVMMMKAECCEALGKTDEAKEFYNKVIEFSPFTTKAYLNLGNILYKEGKNEEAAHIVEEGLKLAPDEMKNINGEYTNWEEKMKDAYNALNPMGLNVNL